MNPEKLCEWIRDSYRNWELESIHYVVVSCISNAKIVEDRMWEFKWLLNTGACRKVRQTIEVLRISCKVWSYLTSWICKERMAERIGYCINHATLVGVSSDNCGLQLRCLNLFCHPQGWTGRFSVCVRTVFWGEYLDLRERQYQKYGENYILRTFVVLILYSVSLGWWNQRG